MRHDTYAYFFFWHTRYARILGTVAAVVSCCGSPPCPHFSSVPPRAPRSPLTVEGHFVGRLVVLDFFTYCCVNCLHVLPDLRRLEASHPAQEGELIVVGVHSAKFDNEKADGSIASACRRHGIRHPVVNDSGADWWRELGVCCWPTILVLDPTATPVAVFLGEGHGRDLHTFIEVALDVYSEQVSR